jgi:hypothetical protein
MPRLDSRAKIALAIGLGLAAAGLLAWVLWTPPRADMAALAPERAMAFVEVPSLPALASGLAETEAWRELSGPLGLSSQLDYAGPVAALLGRIDMGPDDAVALGRGQLAFVVTGVEAGAASEEGEAAVVVRPRFAILLKTHLRAAKARELAASRLPLLARRAYGEQTAVEEAEYLGAPVSIARAPEGGRQIVWAVLDDLVVLGNHEEPVRAVLDTASGRAPSLAGDFYLERLRREVGADRAAVFAFFSQTGVGRLVGIGPGVVAGTLAGDPGRAASVAQLFGGVSEGTVRALAYSGSFEAGGFVDRYYTVVTPALADALAREVTPLRSEPEVLDLVPPSAREVTVMRVERPGESFDAMLTALSSRVDVGVSATLTQIAVELRRGYGVVPEEPVSPMLGDEVAFLDFGDGEPLAAVFEARDRSGLLAVIDRYLRADGASVMTDTYGGTDLLASTHEDGRAAAFVGRYVVLATPAQIRAIVDARGKAEGATESLRRRLEETPDAVLGSRRVGDRSAAELLLAISAALRTSDGSPELLERPDVREAVARLAPEVGVVRLREDGFSSETRSAVGNLTFLTAFMSQ